MYSVSEEYKKALLQKHITDTIEGNITLKDGTVIELDDSTIVTGSLRITHELCDDYRIGTFNLGSMHIGFFDDSALLRDFSGAKIRLTYKIKTESGWEAVPMGIFIADGQSVVRRRNTVTLTAYDYGILFDCNIGTSIRNMSNNAERIISAVCERCGVEFGGIAAGLPNSRVTLSPSSERIHSCRDLIGWCAAVLCGYAVIDREGKLKIISARYSVDTEDPTEIIVDKYLTSAERDSIYSTDTRGWIAQMSAYSGGKTKIYKSNMTHDDAHAARAVYYLENNPLTENMSESLCDLINCEWLKYIDAFLQRGITAELYGDPALDVGDVLRCSEGDIDQRKSVVGLVTKQEWRYRDFHTVICASPQLSDGFEESADEEGESETEAVGETDNVYPVKVVSQSEKRSSGGGKEYYAGDGLTLAENNQFNLNFASASGVGGVYIMGTKSAVFGEEDAAMGVYKNPEKFAALRTATQTQKGGFFLGDGLVPVLEETTNSEGEKAYTFSDTVQLRLGDGLYFEEKSEAPETLEEQRENDLGGRKVSVSKATKEAFGMVKLGEWLVLDEDGKTNVVLKAGDGIDISPAGVVAVRVDDESVKYNEDGQLVATGGLSIDDAVIIKEADAKYLLHNYTEIDYISGNKITYGGAQNQIIAQGLVVYRSQSNAPNGSVLPGANKSWTYGAGSEPVPDISWYTDITFPTAAYDIDWGALSRIYYRYVESGSSSYGSWDKYDHVHLKTDGTEKISSSMTITNYNGYSYGFAFLWDKIYPPGSEYDGNVCEFGYADCIRVYRFMGSDGKVRVYTGGVSYCLPFATEAEYNAAVALTYEPVTMTEVQETITEV